MRIERSEIEETGEYDLEGLFVRLATAIDSVGAKRVALVGMAVLFVVAGGIFYAAGGVNLLTRGLARRALAGELKSKWVRIPAPAAGNFMMGCVPGDPECKPHEKLEDGAHPHRVSLARPFELMTYEVTVAQFRRFSDATSAPVDRWLRPWGDFQETQHDLSFLPG